MRFRFLLLAVALLLLAGSLFGQGQQTATLSGTVTDASGAALPGVTVSVKSPAQIGGERTTVTSAAGDYLLRGLAPGDYTITFSLEGMAPTVVKRTLPLGLTTVADAKMRVAAVTEAITVTASSPTVLENQTVGANIRSETVNQLPIGRAPTDIAALSPGVTGDRGGRATTPVAGQLSINGGMAYDNNFMINGVNFQDNIFGSTNNLFIEDAVQETQVLTSGISAEYGHFTGGVVNVITKSGGNQLTGSFRDNLDKGSWTRLTPYEKGFRGFNAITGLQIADATRAPHVNGLSHIYEVTLGGPVVRDRLWFFLAGRRDVSSAPQSLTLTGINWTRQQTNKRPEVKLTANITQGQTLQVDYLDNPLKRNLEAQVTPISLAALSTNSLRENRGISAFYTGTLTSSLFGEARYAKKHFGFRNLGGTGTTIQQSPMRSSTRFRNNGNSVAGVFNAPYFDATDPEDRNNRSIYGALSYFLSSKGMGSHDLKGGYERFTDERIGGNSQTASGYVFRVAYKTSGGNPVFGPDNDLVPVFTPQSGNGQETRLAYWLATRGAKIDTNTDSVFVNDRWNLNQHWNFNGGLRYEKTKSKATGGITAIDTSNLVPRLGASFDPLANGKYKFDVTYAQYVGRYNPAFTAANSAVGNPSLLYAYYIGPAGEGKNFAPGFDVNNYKFYYANVPTANVRVSKGLHAPVDAEWTLAAGMALPKNGWVKTSYTNRKFKDFIEDFITYDQGCTNVVLGGVNAGCQDNVRYANSNAPKRVYQAVEFQSHYDVTRSWGIEGNWTHQIKNDGTYEGEAGQSIAPSLIGNRPEITAIEREIPDGHLAQYEKDRIRLWTNYGFGLGPAGRLNFGVLFRYDSPLTFSYTDATVKRSAIEQAKDPGYKGVTPNSTVTTFFGSRGAGQWNTTRLFDISARYDVPVWRVTPWVKFDIRNVFNKETQIGGNTTVVADTTSPLDQYGYRTGYTKAATFGRPTAATSYVIPRQYVAAIGLRF